MSAQESLASIPQIIADLAQGRMCILVDDENRENEGDLVVCADMVTPEHINFMATHGRGLVCLAMSAENIERLSLPYMTENNQCPQGTAFTLSIDAKDGVTTAISAFDRAHTIRLAANPESRLSDFRIPGHVFPLRSRANGVLEREGHTEAAVDLAHLAGFSGGGVICEIMHDDGHMMRLPDLVVFAQKHDLKIGSIAALKDYILAQAQQKTA